MTKKSLIWISMRRLKGAMLRGEPSPFTVTDLSEILNFDLERGFGLSGQAIDALTAHLHPHNRYVIGLGLGHLAIEAQDSVLADNAAQLMISAAEDEPLLDGADFATIIQRLATMRRCIA
tara:strand:- start:116 stop:475 length:360 start_codon:yes stop_codon:yes gene_type:complete